MDRLLYNLGKLVSEAFVKHRDAVIALIILILIFTSVFTTLLHLRHKTFFSHDWRDEAVNNQLIYNTSHGNLLFSTIKGPMIFHRHFRPIFFLTAIPWVFYDEIGAWFFTVSFILALGALAVYRLARQRFKSVGLGLAFAIAYLTWPPLHEIAMGNYDPETLVATFWLFAILYYDSEKIVGFWIFALLALICKETMAVVLFGLAIMAMIHRRNRRWWIPMAILAPVWFFACVKLIIPIYHPTFDTIYGRFFGCETGGGSFPHCFISALISDPKGALNAILSREHRMLFRAMIKGVPLWGILGLEWLIPAAPVALMILVHKNPHPVRQVHILSSMLPFIFIAGMMSIERAGAILSNLTKEKIRETDVAKFLLVIFFVSNIYLFFQPGLFGKFMNYGNDPVDGFKASRVFDKEFFKYTKEHAAAWETISLIPDNQPVMTNNRFLLALSSRHDLREFGTQNILDDFHDSKYLLISLIQPPCHTCTYNELTTNNLNQLSELVEKGLYKVARAFDDHTLLVRRDIDGFLQTESIKENFFSAIEKAREKLVK